MWRKVEAQAPSLPAKPTPEIPQSSGSPLMHQATKSAFGSKPGNSIGVPLAEKVSQVHI